MGELPSLLDQTYGGQGYVRLTTWSMASSWSAMLASTVMPRTGLPLSTDVDATTGYPSAAAT